jgi:rsbT antagonist protein RsbS
MSVPVLQQGHTLIVMIQAALTDAELDTLRTDLARQVGEKRILALVVDVSALDVMDSFATRTLLAITKVARLRGARALIVGIQPDVAFAMVQLGLTLEGVDTALDLDEALAIIAERQRRSPSRAR